MTGQRSAVVTAPARELVDWDSPRSAADRLAASFASWESSAAVSSAPGIMTPVVPNTPPVEIPPPLELNATEERQVHSPVINATEMGWLDICCKAYQLDSPDGDVSAGQSDEEDSVDSIIASHDDAKPVALAVASPAPEEEEQEERRYEDKVASRVARQQRLDKLYLPADIAHAKGEEGDSNNINHEGASHSKYGEGTWDAQSLWQLAHTHCEFFINRGDPLPRLLGGRRHYDSEAGGSRGLDSKHSFDTTPLFTSANKISGTGPSSKSGLRIPSLLKASAALEVELLIRELLRTSSEDNPKADNIQIPSTGPASDGASSKNSSSLITMTKECIRLGAPGPQRSAWLSSFESYAIPGQVHLMGVVASQPTLVSTLPNDNEGRERGGGHAATDGISEWYQRWMRPPTALYARQAAEDHRVDQYVDTLSRAALACPMATKRSSESSRRKMNHAPRQSVANVADISMSEK